MKNWKFLTDTIPKTLEDVVLKLIALRDISERNLDLFFEPDIKSVTLRTSGIDVEMFKIFKIRLEKSIKEDEKIIIYGDYDVDGISASAILWETIFARTKHVLPYIPDRVDEGYGLSKKGIDNLLLKHPDTSLIITVDNGIVANKAVEYATKKGIDVIVTDHHVKSEKLPLAFAILHTTSLCGAGIAWVIAKELKFESEEKISEKLSLAALATVADLVPLTQNNRTIVKIGLEILKNTKREGLLELLREAGIDRKNISIYVIGHVIAPRLNASGRIQSAMNALRLLCTTNRKKAVELAMILSSVNKERQEMTEESVKHAKMLSIENNYSSKITVVAHETYNQGIIGLVASKLVESYYKPAFAISKGNVISKGSARSIKGVNIIELLRSVAETLIDAGGHPMAAGFSLETLRIEEFIKALSKKADDIITDDMLMRFIAIDMILPFGLIEKKLVRDIAHLGPFGMGNPEPVFATKNVEIFDVRKIGKERNHLKLKLSKDKKIFDAIAFGFADKIDVDLGDKVDVAYVIDENEWNGKVSLQLKIRDIKMSDFTV